MQKTYKILSYLKNKYIIAVLVFLMLIFFYDRNDIFVQLERSEQLNTLQKSKSFYQNEIDKTKKELTSLEGSPRAVEKYAREHFFMKKDNEEVFIVDSVAKEVKP
ncbi:MAG TPA: septum formation initiator family protein [Arachidicoccus sp.]|nr:septum formation initiator family protein [Arachidicoccus sp.]